MGSLTFCISLMFPRRPSTLSEPTADPLPERSEDRREGTGNHVLPDDSRGPSGGAHVETCDSSSSCFFVFFYKYLGLCHGQHLHRPLPSPGVLPLAGSISMETAVSQEGSAQEKASLSTVLLSWRRVAWRLRWVQYSYQVKKRYYVYYVKKKHF